MSDNRIPTKLNKVDKAAILLLSLGETDAAQVLRHLGPKEVQRVGTAMAQMRNVQKAQIEQVMGEFVEIVGTAQVKGGCKNSAIAIEPDGSRLYYMDVNAGRVLVLTRTAHPTGDAPKQVLIRAVGPIWPRMRACTRRGRMAACALSCRGERAEAADQGVQHRGSLPLRADAEGSRALLLPIQRRHLR